MRDATQDGPWAFLHFSPLTFASYAVLLGAVAALLVLSSPSFYDFVPAEKAARAPAAEEAPGSPGAEDRKHFRLVVVGLVLNIITKGSIGCYETLGVSYAEQNLQLSGPKTGAGAASNHRGVRRRRRDVLVPTQAWSWPAAVCSASCSS